MARPPSSIRRFTDAAQALVALGRHLRDHVRRSLGADADRVLAAPERDGATDVQYAIDRVSEEGLAEAVVRHAGALGPIRLMSEGLPPAGITVGAGAPQFRLLLDPIDGTRGLMHDKRSAFVLAAIAPEKPGVRMSEAFAAAMVEIPTSRSEKSDVFSAARSAGVTGFTEDLSSGVRVPLLPRPSKATSLAHGFATFARFIPGAMDRIGALAEDFFDRVFAGDAAGRAAVFEDQYISTGGQFHALLTGRDRFAADLRPLFPKRGGGRMLAAHPYDVAGALILEEAGVPLTDATGRALDAPFELEPEVAWIGWANAALRAALEPHLLRAMASATA